MDIKGGYVGSIYFVDKHRTYNICYSFLTPNVDKKKRKKKNDNKYMCV